MSAPPSALERPFFAILALFALWRQMEVPTYFFRSFERTILSFERRFYITYQKLSDSSQVMPI